MKIQERVLGRASYPQQNLWPMQRDRETFEYAINEYKELYTNQYLTYMVFQSANISDYPQAIALAEWIVFRNAVIFRSQELYENKNKVLKHLYDCIRIISLRICSGLNKQLIALYIDGGQHRDRLK